MAASPPSVVVVGAGIIGSSIAFHLAARGCAVRLLEALHRPGAACTARSWAWINANRKRPKEYRDFNCAGMDEWRRFPSIVDFCGLLWLNDDLPLRPDYPSTRVTAGQLEPALAPDLQDACSQLYEQEGVVDPVAATHYFVKRAQEQELGAIVLAGEGVEKIEVEGGRAAGVVTAGGKQYPAEVVVIAAGVDTPRLVEPLGASIPLLDLPGVIIRTKPLPRLLSHMIIAEGIFLHQSADGRVLIGENKSPPSKDTSHTNGERILRLAQRVIPALNVAEIEIVDVGFRPYPRDGLPVVGFLSQVRNVFVAVTHSGATLAPLIGRLAAAEIVDGHTPDELLPYQASREFSEQDVTRKPTMASFVESPRTSNGKEQ